ncbi:transposase [Corynebacterium cystitidis]|uniref:transposase n=1 Tax=Corynebacterium cystitidis TaxID=35757 RepID=UPI00211EE01B|nr:transposase [Corynebacterium cystitidis]
MSMPRIGIKTAANILLSIRNSSGFRSAGHLTTYVDIIPVTRRSGTCTRVNFLLNRAANGLETHCSTPCSPPSIATPQQGLLREETRREQKHNAVTVCLARRRCNAIYVMLKQGESYRDQPAINAA